MNSILKSVLKKIAPSTEETKSVKKIEKKVIKLLKNEAKKNKVVVQIVLGGSASRNTFMKGDYDLDFFMRFKNEKDIKKYYKKIVKKTFNNLKLIHGTRDYYTFTYEGYDVEIIPSKKYKNPNKAENSADVSYFHINYLKKKLNPKLIKQVLLLKQFLKANDVYGAESARKGFSGYVTELLIIHFKTFRNLLKYIENNPPKIIIDIEKHYKNNEEALKAIGKTKSANPIVIVDPILPKRNASASLSYETYSKFLFKARYFLREPMYRLFNKRGVSIKLVLERSNRRGTRILEYKLKPYKGDNNVYKAKVLKKMKQLKNLLNKDGWVIHSYGVTDENILFFELETLKNSKAKKHYGPLVWVEKKNFDAFFRKWKNNLLGKPYVEGNRLIVDIFRKKNVVDEIKNYLKDFVK